MSEKAMIICDGCGKTTPDRKLVDGWIQVHILEVTRGKAIHHLFGHLRDAAGMIPTRIDLCSLACLSKAVENAGMVTPR